MKNSEISFKEFLMLVIVIGMIASVIGSVITILNYLFKTFSTFFTIVDIILFFLSGVFYLKERWEFDIKIRRLRKDLTNKVSNKYLMVEIDNPNIESSLKPSKGALFFAAILQKPEDRDSFLGCVEKRYEIDVEKFGTRWAKFMLWRDNFASLWSFIGAKVVRLLKWVGFGYLIEKILLK